MPDPVQTPPSELLIWALMTKHALTVALARYVLMAGPAFVLCYLLLGRMFSARRIQPGEPPATQLRREVGWSVSSCLIFAVIDVIVIQLSAWGMMRARIWDPNPALPAFVATVIGLLIIHDAYFYWAHRFMHWKPVYRFVHATHHRSLSPTPFAAFAFHPFEAVIQYAFVPLIALVVPIHLMPLLVFGLIMTAMNVYAHLGFEFMPAGFLRNRVGRLVLTPTHHDLHHTTPPYDFAFYFNIWDRLMGTIHPHYEKEFERITTRAEAAAAD